MNQRLNVAKLRLQLALAERNMTLGELGRLAGVPRETMKKMSGGFGGNHPSARARVESVLERKIWPEPVAAPTPLNPRPATIPAATADAEKTTP